MSAWAKATVLREWACTADRMPVNACHGGVVLAAGFDSEDPTLRLSDADITEAQINQFVFLQQEVGFAALCLDVIVVAHLLWH